LCVDKNGLIYVTSYTANTVTVFTAGATGNVAPLRQIVGSNTQLSAPEGCQLDSNLNLWVDNFNGDSITEYGPTANGNATPIAVLNTGVQFGFVFDHNGRIIVPTGNAVMIFAAGATGNATPLQTIQGSNTGFQNVNTVGVDAQNNIYVADDAQFSNAIYVFPSTANGNVTPTRTISGSSTTFNTPYYPTIF
jgi:hypothetical protein